MPTHVQISPDEDIESHGVVPPYTPVVGAGPTAPSAAPVPASMASAGPPATLTAAPQAAPPARAQPMAASAPSPLIAGILSIFLPGVGQMYAGQTLKGFVLLVVAFFTVGLCGLLNLVAAFDAYKIAQRRTLGEPVSDWQFF